MKIHKDLEQGTEAWFKAKSGKPSTSSFHLMMANGRAKGSMGLTAHSYARRLAAERWLNYNFASEEFQSFDMKRGSELEPYALQYYHELTGDIVTTIGGIDNQGCFCSTDGLTEDSVIEIKCPKYPNHLKYLLDNSQMVDKDYLWQLHGEMWLADKDNAQVISYHPTFGDKQVVITIERDDLIIGELKDRLKLFEPLVKDYLKQFKKLK